MQTGDRISDDASVYIELISQYRGVASGIKVVDLPGGLYAVYADGILRHFPLDAEGVLRALATYSPQE